MSGALDFFKKHPMLTVGGGLAAAGGMYLLYRNGIGTSTTASGTSVQGSPSTSYLYPGQNLPGVSVTGSGSSGGSGIRSALASLTQKLATLSGAQARTQGQLLAQQSTQSAQQNGTNQILQGLKSQLTGLTTSSAQQQAANQAALAGVTSQVTGLSTQIKGLRTTSANPVDVSAASAKPTNAIQSIRQTVVSQNPIHPSGGYSKSLFTGSGVSSARTIPKATTPITSKNTLVSSTPISHPGRPMLTSGGSSGYAVQTRTRATQTRTQKAAQSTPVMSVQRGRFRAFA